MTGKHSDVPWWQRETIRVRGYSVCAALVGIFVLREWISAEEAGYVLMALAAVLGVYGVESIRSRTTPDVIITNDIAPKIKHASDEIPPEHVAARAIEESMDGRREE